MEPDTSVLAVLLWGGSSGHLELLLPLCGVSKCYSHRAQVGSWPSTFRLEEEEPDFFFFLPPFRRRVGKDQGTPALGTEPHSEDLL